MDNHIKKIVKTLNSGFISALEVDRNMDHFNKLLDGYGVESLAKDGYFHKNYFGQSIALYVNMGNSYQETVFFDTSKLRYFVGDMEKASKRFRL